MCSREEERLAAGETADGRWQHGDVRIANTLRHFAFCGANVALITVRPLLNYHAYNKICLTVSQTVRQSVSCSHFAPTLLSSPKGRCCHLILVLTDRLTVCLSGAKSRRRCAFCGANMALITIGPLLDLILLVITIVDFQLECRSVCLA